VDPDEALLAAFAALRRHDPAAVLAALDGLRAPTRPGLEARAAAYRAQALRSLGRLDEAERAAADAVQLARRADDPAGVEQLRVLHASILAGLAATRAATVERTRDAVLADTSDDVLLAGCTGAERAAALVRKAGALTDAGRLAEALACAARARAEAQAAGSPREEVLGWLCAVRAAPDDAHALLASAHAVADAANDANLVTAVAQAARAAGVALAPPAFG
jgi:tetratricopeptide (TPR) repeat protein